MKELQIMRGALKVDNSITLITVRYIGKKYGAFLFCKSNIGAENKDPKVYV